MLKSKNRKGKIILTAKERIFLNVYVFLRMRRDSCDDEVHYLF